MRALACHEKCAELAGVRSSCTSKPARSASLGHARFGEHWLHLDPPRHLQLFEASSLRELAERAGFEVQELRTPASSAHFLWQASSLLAKQGRLHRIDLGGASLALKLRSIVFWAQEYARTRKGDPCGEELLLVARRPAGKRP